MAYENLNEHLRQARRKCGFTQEQVAQTLGIDRSSYTYYETGKTEPNVEYLVRLSEMFRTDLETLIRGEEAVAAMRDKDTLFQLSTMTLEEQKIILRFRSMSEERRQAWMSVLEVL